MVLYLNNKVFNTYLNGKKYNFIVAFETNETIPDNVLIDLNNYYLKDSENDYLFCLADNNLIGRLLLTVNNESIFTKNGKEMVTVRKGE